MDDTPAVSRRGSPYRENIHHSYSVSNILNTTKLKENNMSITLDDALEALSPRQADAMRSMTLEEAAPFLQSLFGLNLNINN